MRWHGWEQTADIKVHMDAGLGSLLLGFALKKKNKWAFELVAGPWAAYSLVGLDLELFKLLVILGLS